MYETVQEWVFPFIKNLHSDKNSAYSKYMDDAIFKLPTPLVLSKVIDSLDDIYDSTSKSEKKISEEMYTNIFCRRLRQQVEMVSSEHQDILLK